MFVTRGQLGNPPYVAQPAFGEPWTAAQVRSHLWFSGVLKVADAGNSTYLVKPGLEGNVNIFADRYGWTQPLLNAAGVLYTLPPGVGGVVPADSSAVITPQPQTTNPASSLPAGSDSNTSGDDSWTVTTTLYPGQTSLPPETQESGLQNTALLMGLMGLGLLILLPKGRAAARRRAARRGRK